MFRYDLYYGFRDCRLKWLGALLVQIYFANAAYQACSMAGGPVGALGYLTWLFQGKPEYFAAETGRFELPVPWLLLHACLLFLVGFYPANDLTRSGGQAFVRMRRRRDWLLGKAVWVVGTAAAYYVCLAIILMLYAFLAEGLAGQAYPEKWQMQGAGWNVFWGKYITGSPEALKSLFGIPIAEMGGMAIFLSWWAEPFLVSVTLCLAEMVLSLVLEPALALFLALGYLTASVFWAEPALLGNYAMLMRQDFWSGIEAVSFSGCVAGCGVFSAAVLMIGMKLIRKKDIFQTEECT